MVLVCNFLMTNDVKANFHALIGHLYIFFGEISVQIHCPKPRFFKRTSDHMTLSSVPSLPPHHPVPHIDLILATLVSFMSFKQATSLSVSGPLHLLLSQPGGHQPGISLAGHSYPSGLRSNVTSLETPFHPC